MLDKQPKLKEGKFGMKLLNLQTQHLELMAALLAHVRLGEGASRVAAFELMEALDEYDTTNSIGFTYNDAEGMVIEVDNLDEY